jgi:dTDP-4-dehydrorhamnose 3,5-epimerase
MRGDDSDDIAPEFRSTPKDYSRPAPIDGVKTMRLRRFTDDRGFFLEIFRAKANHPESRELAGFFQNVPVEQMNYSIVDVEGHVKGLHYHLEQDDIWFVPPPSKAKFVLYDIREKSPTFGRTQVIVAGGGQDVLVRIPRASRTATGR